MTEKHAELEGLIERVCDGDSIDWDREASSLRAEQGLVEQLRLLSSIRDSLATQGEGATRADPEPGPLSIGPESLWGSLRLLERIGKGSFGEVYRAWDPALEREVALKLLSSERTSVPGSSDRFLDEARRLARVRHANVVTVHGADRHGGRVGLWMELVRGRTLEDLLSASGPLGPHETIVVGLEVCRALAAVHAAGLVHGDVKTSNVMRERGGRIVLMDFGAVHLVGARPGEALSYGTPVAMSPEQLRAESIGVRTDLYGLGVLLFRLFTGRYPDPPTPGEALRPSGSASSRRLRDLRPDAPASLVSVIERAMEHEPAARFSSAGEMEAALSKAAGLGAATRPEAHASRWPRRAITGILLLASILAGTLLVREASPPPARNEPVTSPRTTPPVEATGEPGERRPTNAAAPPEAFDARRTAAEPRTEVHLYRETGTIRSILNRGDRVSPGSRLSMDLLGAAGRHVYVLNEDDHGNVFVLFPIPGLETTNPLPRVPLHRLPGHLDGHPMHWQVTSVGGREAILVIASNEPLIQLERDIAKHPRARTGADIVYGQAGREALAVLRGIGGLTPATPRSGAEQSRLSEVFAKAGIAPRRGVWVWQTELHGMP